MRRWWGNINRPLERVTPQGGTFFRTGLVAEQSVSRGRVRVRFPDRDNLLSNWLPFVAGRTQDDKHFVIPDLGAQVVCFMDALDEDGAVLGEIYSRVDTVPGGASVDRDFTQYKDGTKIYYDRADSVLRAEFPDGAVLQYDATASRLTVQTPGTAEITVTQQTKLLCPDIIIGVDGAGQPVALLSLLAKYNGHTHGGVDTGGGTTSPPNSNQLDASDFTQNAVIS